MPFLFVDFKLKRLGAKCPKNLLITKLGLQCVIFSSPICNDQMTLQKHRLANVIDRVNAVGRIINEFIARVISY